MKYQSFAHKKFCLEYHIEFVTKERRTWITDFKTEEKLKQIFETIANEFNVEIKACGVQPDHIHIYIAAKNTDFNIVKFIQALKGKSSYLIKKEIPTLRNIKDLWAKGYFVATTGPTPNYVVKDYVEKQDLSRNLRDLSKKPL
jgi:putative transposase